MRVLLPFAGAFIGMVLFAVGRSETSIDKGTTTISSDGHSVTLTRAPNGHFYTNAMVNGRQVNFMIDTGATTVALSREDAAKAGIVLREEGFTRTAQTASGEVRIMPVVLDSVDIGNLEVPQVQAAVVDGDLQQSLLGQSWLSKMDSVQIEQDQMVLRR